MLKRMMFLAVVAWVVVASGAQAGSLDFEEHGRYGVAQPHRAAAGDLNNDGNLDLVIPAYDNDLAVLLGDGTGAMGPPSYYSAGYREVGAIIADFNNDQNLDAAVMNNDSANFSVMLGDGTGALSEHATYSTGSYPHGSTKGDFNNDSIVDLATISWLGNTMTVFIGDGNGNFSSTAFPMGTNLNGVASGDFNGDNKEDLLVSKYYSESVAQFWGNGDGTFTQSADVPMPSGGWPHGMAAGDLNKDGFDDMAVYLSVLDRMSVFLGSPGGLQWKQDLPGLRGTQRGTELADFDDDGNLDLPSRRDNDAFVVLRGLGDGTFVEDFVHDFADVVDVGAVTPGDYDNNGYIDLAVTLDDASVAIFLNTIPEPGTMALLALGACVALLRRSKMPRVSKIRRGGRGYGG